MFSLSFEFSFLQQDSRCFYNFDTLDFNQRIDSDTPCGAWGSSRRAPLLSEFKSEIRNPKSAMVNPAPVFPSPGRSHP
jgi:hypothetical protein